MFRGIIPALVTPLHQDNTINLEVLCKLLDYQLEQGADGFYIAGATGEGLVLQPEARMQLAEAVVEHLKGKKPCIAHIAAADLTTSIKLARHAERVGCDCVAAIPPVFFHYTEDDVFNYYKAISEAVSIPVMVYYHPAAGIQMSARFFAKLFTIDNIKAVKWSKRDYYEMLLLKDFTQGDMNILNGPDETLLCGLAAGADGGIGTTYNFLLPIYRTLYQEFVAGNTDAARQAQFAANRIISVALEHPIIPVTKLVLRSMGFDVGEATAPMMRFDTETGQHLMHRLKEAGLQW